MAKNDDRLASLRIVEADGSIQSTEAIRGALSHQSHQIDIYSNRWGPAPNNPYSDDGVTRSVLADGVSSGRGGLGSIYVFAAGNGLEFGDGHSDIRCQSADPQQ
jgi:hypothetical protein